MLRITGILTTAEVDEVEANSYEAKAKIALIFSAKFYILIPFSQKNEIFGRFSTELQKFGLITGFNVELYQ